MILKIGSKGEKVRRLQSSLAELGFPVGTVDGDFGKKTLQAVRKWQEQTFVDGTIDDSDLDILLHLEKKFSEPASEFVQVLSKQECIEVYGRPWAEPDWWQKNGAACNLGLEFSHIIKPRKYGGVLGCFIWCNKDMVKPLELVFKDIVKAGLQHEVKSFDGCFCVRMVRGSEDSSGNLDNAKWSTHTWALAIDINAKTNGLGIEGDLHRGIIDIFVARGFVAGANFKRKDFMHFQWCKGF